MKAFRFSIITLVALLALSIAAFAQTTGTQPQAGFTVETLISQISLYLPEEATQGMLGGFGRGGAGGGGAATGTGTGTQGTARQGQATGQAAGPGGFGQLFQFTRDAKLYLTKDQINKLLPIFTGLKDNPMPTPSKAKTVQSSVDAILTAAQKAEFVAYQKQMQKAIEDMRKQFAASGAAAGANGAGGFPGGGAAPGGEPGQARTGQGGGAAQVTPLQRRQREVDAFIKVLQDRLKQVGA